ncbi:hypothetical protein [Metabacillus sp. cB07]|uniref:hypothetical protein n=1 Tax=Metabacillus sp. cB07 TaxID=2806989 RepID=UPI001939AA50|nr:hypothetical protein [Metabacillus sp. cB07]
MFGQSLSGLYEKIHKKEQELSDLKTAGAKLLSLYEDFSSNESLCMEPSLSANTFQGMNANGFERHREYEVFQAYRELKDEQLVQGISMVEYYINKIEDEIEELKNQIAALEAEEKAKND